MDRFEIPRAYMHYTISRARLPDQPQTVMIINIVYRTILLNLDAKPDANVIRVTMRT